MKKLWIKIIDVIENIKMSFKIFKNSVKNLIKYFKVIWEDRDFDFYYIYALLDKKLEFIEKRYSDNKFLKSATFNNNLKYIKLSRKLIEMSITEHYQASYWEHIERRIKESNIIDEELKTKYRKIYNKHSDKPQRIRQVLITHELDKKADKLLWKIISNNIKSWWD